MSLFSKQQIFCNCCGKELFEIPHTLIGRKFKVCSMKCHAEMEYRSASSVLGKEYIPWSHS